LTLNACSWAQFAPARVDVAYPQRTPPDKIELFRSANPSKPFDEIGAATACCSGDVNAMVDKLREKASECGGDALIALDVRANGRATATVVRYR
jgi:hypothetical protein